MGKNHRLKKKQKSERAKVQLKAKNKTKFLPKGQNVTDVKFKVKPIVLSEQLGEKKDNVPLSKRKLDVTDLLKRLGHHNDNVKVAACEELDVMLKVHSEQIFLHHLADLVRTVPRLVLELEQRVRRPAIKVITTMLQLVPESKLDGQLYDLLVSQLNCAMLDINRNVQEDSLLLFDAMVQHTPALVANDCNDILPKLFMLISRFNREGGLHTLDMDLGNKVAPVKWQIRLLKSVYCVFSAIIEDAKRKKAEDESKVLSYSWEVHGSNTPLYDVRLAERLRTSDYDVWYRKKSSLTEENIESWQSYLPSLMSLIHEAWLEVAPRTERGVKLSDYTMLTEEESVLTLRGAVNILYLFQQYTQLEEDNEELVDILTPSEHLLSDLMKGFPYNQEATQRGKKGTATTLRKVLVQTFGTSSDPNCARENLLVCHLALVPSYLNSRKGNEGGAKTECYLKDCLLNKIPLGKSDTGLLLRILRQVLLDTKLKTRGPNRKTVLRCALAFHTTNHPRLSPEHSVELTDIFVDVTRHTELGSLEIFAPWIDFLKAALLQPTVSGTVLDVILLACRRGVRLVMHSMHEQMPSILENLDRLGTSAEVGDGERKKIADIFFQMAHFTESDYERIVKFVETTRDEGFRRHFADMLSRCAFMGKLREFPRQIISDLDDKYGTKYARPEETKCSEDYSVINYFSEY